MAITHTGRIARKNARITFQKRTVTTDKYKNHVSSWEDYFTCWAYANTYSANETGEEVTYEEKSVTFETRHCPELAAVSSVGYRIIFGGEQYEIQSVDPMNYQNQSIRFTCQREKRQKTETAVEEGNG